MLKILAIKMHLLVLNEFCHLSLYIRYTVSTVNGSIVLLEHMHQNLSILAQQPYGKLNVF